MGRAWAARVRGARNDANDRNVSRCIDPPGKSRQQVPRALALVRRTLSPKKRGRHIHRWRPQVLPGETLGLAPYSLPEDRDPIERAQPEPSPPRAEDHGLAGLPSRRRPVLLVAVVPTQEVEPAIALPNRALDHQAHQHQPHAFSLPARGAPALVEVHRVVGAKAVPSRCGLPVEVQRAKPESVLLRHFTGELPLQALAARVSERSSARIVPALLVQPQQRVPALVEAVFPIVHNGCGVISKQAALLAAQDLASVRAQRREVVVPRTWQLEPRTAPQRAPSDRVPACRKGRAQPLRVRGSVHEIVEDDDLPRHGFDRRGEGLYVSLTQSQYVKLIRTAELPDGPVQRTHPNPVEAEAAQADGQHGLERAVRTVEQENTGRIHFRGRRGVCPRTMPSPTHEWGWRRAARAQCIPCIGSERESLQQRCPRHPWCGWRTWREPDVANCQQRTP